MSSQGEGVVFVIGVVYVCDVQLSFLNGGLDGHGRFQTEDRAGPKKLFFLGPIR